MLNRFAAFLLTHFPWFILVYFTLQILVRMLTTSGLVIDESEQMLLTQYFALGYNAQPPLYTWIQMLFFAVFGPGIVALSLLKNLLLALAYLFTYLTGYRLTGDRRTAAIGAVSLLLLPQIVGEAQVDQIHSILVTTAAAATLYTLVRLLQDGKTSNFLFLGLAVGCGILAKYNFLLVVFSLLLGTILIREYRRRLFRPQLLLAVFIAAALVTPHLVWFVRNPALATAETLQRMQFEQTGTYLLNVLKGSADLAVAVIAFVAPFLVLYLLLFRVPRPAQWTAQARLLGIFIAASLISIVLVVLITEATQIKQRWLQPVLFAFPLFLFVLWSPARLAPLRITIFTVIAVSVAIIVTALIPLRVYLVDLSDDPRRDNYPFQSLAEIIRKNGFSQGTILTEDKFIGGNMRLFFKDATIITPSIPQQPYHLTEQLLVVWQEHDPVGLLDDEVLARYKCKSDLVKLPFHHSRIYTYQARYRICQLMDPWPATEEKSLPPP